MKVLVIGLGSMGKRRIRCLQSMGNYEIVGYDTREDRIYESEKLYDIKTFTDDSFTTAGFECAIISVPPDQHLNYIEKCVRSITPSFVEASVLSDHGYKILDLVKESGVFIAPSCTMIFNPVIKNLKEIIDSGKYGRISNFTYHCGQFLPDWHPWEGIKDFYVSKRETGGAREIVPFELTWLTSLLGYPVDIKGYFGKTIDLGVGIEDTYSFLLKYKQGLGSMIVDVSSRYATRSLILNLEKAQIRWNWEDNGFTVYEADKNHWVKYDQQKPVSHNGYNENINEQIYIDELEAFFAGIEDPKKYPNSIDSDLQVLKLLNQIENSDGGF